MTGPLLLGAGGHARVLAEALVLSGQTARGYLAPDPAARPFDPALPHLGDDAALDGFDPATTPLVCALGSVGDASRRLAVWDRARALGFSFAQVVHPRAIRSPGAETGAGLQLLAGAVLQTGARLGANVIVNTRAVVEHDCRVGDNVHLAPGSCLSGGVEIGAGAHIGAGAVVLEGRSIGAGAIIGAGAVVTGDVPPGQVWAGNPARKIREVTP